MNKKRRAGILAATILALVLLMGNTCWAAVDKAEPFKVVGYYSGSLFDEPAE